MRNRIIGDIFLRLGIIERLSTGIRRIKEYYIGSINQPVFDVKENSIKVILPKVLTNVIKESKEIEYKALNEDESKLIDYIKENGEISRKQAEDILCKGKPSPTRS
jgi:ATP-dependent DNA helicase RecG